MERKTTEPHIDIVNMNSNTCSNFLVQLAQNTKAIPSREQEHHGLREKVVTTLRFVTHVLP